MRGSSTLLGLIGVIALVFAGVAAALSGMGGGFAIAYIAIHAGVGVLALIAYLSTGLENLRSFVGQRSTRYGANAVLYSAIFVAILILGNYMSARHHHRWDLTEAGVYSLSPQSKTVVEGLKNDLVLKAFVQGGENPGLRDLLDSYAYASKKVSFQMIDPERDPVAAEQNKITAYNSVHLQYGNETTVITEPTEQTLTNAIIKVTREQKKVVCFLEGHGEPPLDNADDPRGFSSAKEALTNENYEVKSILLASLEKVPEDCSLVIVGGPQKALLENEVRVLESYMDNGGRLLALLPPRVAGELKPLLAKWGVRLGDDVLVDQVMRIFEGPTLGLAPLANSYAQHDITRSFRERTIFPMSRSVSSDAAGKSDLTVTELVKTGPNSWAESDLAGVFERSEVHLDPAVDKAGPVSVAVAVEGKSTVDGKQVDVRMVVIGSSEFAQNRNLEGTFYNRDLFLNAAGWLVGQGDLLSIRPRAMRTSTTQLTENQQTVIFFLSVLVLPEFLMLMGIVVWWRRSNA